MIQNSSVGKCKTVKHILPSFAANAKTMLIEETNVELQVYVYIIYKIIKRKLQVYAISGMCFKNYIDAKTIMCVIRLEKDKFKQPLSRNMKKVTHQKI